MTRLNPNRSEFIYRYLRMHQAEDALRLGYILHPEAFIGTPYQQDSILAEWICNCPDPLEKPPMSKSIRSATCPGMARPEPCPLWSAAFITYSRAS